MEIRKDRTKEKRPIIYSDSFKLKVIGEVLNGEITKAEARRVYCKQKHSGLFQQLSWKHN